MTCRKLLVFVLVGFLFALNPALVSPAPASDLKKALELNQEVNRLLQKADYKGAIRAAEEMAACCGSHEECLAYATYWLGACNLDLGRLDLASERLREAQRSFSRLGKRNDEAVATYQLGRVFALTGDYAQALTYFDRAENRLDRKLELAKLYLARASVYTETGEPDAARKDVNKAKRIFTDPNHKAMLNVYEALIDTATQNYEKARRLYAEAMTDFRSRQPQNLVGIAQALSSIGLVDETQGKYAAAESNYRKALAIARDTGSRSTQASVLNNLGNLNWLRGNYDAAMKCYEEALQIQESLGQKHLIAKTLNNMGVVYFSQADYQHALDLFADAYGRASKVGSPESQAWALHDMAFVYKDLGQFVESETAEDKAIKIAEKIKNRRLQATARLRLGNLYEYFGDFDGALKEYEKAAELQREIRDQLYLSHTLLSMAELFTRMADTDSSLASTSPNSIMKADKQFQSALRIKEKIGAPLVEPLCKYALFHIEKHRYGWRGNTDRALRDAEALIVRAKSELKPDAKNDKVLLAYVMARYDLERDPEKSIAEFATLESLAQKAGSLRFLFLAKVGTGLAAEKLKRFDEAEIAYQAAVDYAESIRDTLKPREKRTFLHGEEILGIKHVLPYEGLARVRFKKEEKKASLEASERTKARSFSDKMAGVGAGAGTKVDPRLLKRLGEVEKKVQTSYEQLMKCRGDQGDTTIVQQLAGEITVLKKKRTEIEQRVKAMDPSFYAARFGVFKKLDEFALAPDEWAIAYEVTDTGVIIYLTKGKTLIDSWFAEVPRRELTGLVRSFRRPLQVDGKLKPKHLLAFKEVMDVGRQLWDLLIAAPIKHVPRGDPIVVSPDDVLGLLPFEILIQDAGTGWDQRDGSPYPKGARYLADRNDIVYCQSLTALSLARQLPVESGSATRTLAIVDPIFDKDDPRLGKLEVEQRRKAVGSLPDKLMSLSGLDWPRLELTGELGISLQKLDHQRTDLFEGMQAKKSILVTKDLHRYRHMVFATHGYFGTGIPGIQEPIVVFTLVDQPEGQDGFLRMNEVMGLRMNADVVALTGCQTGLGRYVSGEGSMSMGRAFRYAGAQSVLMSLWNVSEKASVSLVESFFAHLKAGKGRSEALRLARQEIRKAGHEHPFFWGAFVLAGER